MINLFRTPKPKQFKYRPIFYDPAKEELKKREQQIKQELGLADENTPRISLIKGQMRGYYNRKVRTARDGKTNLRLVVIIIILCAIAYYLFYY